MTITVPLQPQEEARLVAAAEAKGISTAALVREAINKLVSEPSEPNKIPTSESRPIWELLLDNMKDVSPEEFAKLPKNGASELDHYLCGHPKRAQ